jgi:mannitol-1-phosphate 5-dehydrogenase
VKKTLKRITSPAIDDQVERVGRDPIRKLSRLERLIGPAAQYAEHYGRPEHLLDVISAALAFENDDDPEVARLQLLLTSLSTSEFAQEVCGISSSHPLAQYLVETIDNHKRQVARQGLLG